MWAGFGVYGLKAVTMEDSGLGNLKKRRHVKQTDWRCFLSRRFLFDISLAPFPFFRIAHIAKIDRIFEIIRDVACAIF